MDMTMFRRRGLLLSTPHIVNESGSIVTFDSAYNKIPIKSLICNIEPIQEGSGDPSPDNVRPITGRTELSVARTGVNVWDEEWEQGGISPNDGMNFANASTRIRSKNYISIKPGATYYFALSFIYPHVIAFYDVQKNFISGAWVNSLICVAPQNAYFLRFCTNDDYGLTYKHDISINYPSTDTDYHPYAGNTHSVNWETEAGTVYGGTMDVVSGKLTVGMMYKELQNITQWQKSVSYPGGFYSAVGNFAEDGHEIKTFTQIICTHAKTARTLSEYVPGTCYMDNTVSIRIMSAETTIAQWAEYLDAQKTAGTPVSCCLYLANPYIVQLTPQEVKTLLGVNSIWCDSGDVSVDYWKWGK